jgi:hypothetical protein
VPRRREDHREPCCGEPAKVWLHDRELRATTSTATNCPPGGTRQVVDELGEDRLRFVVGQLHLRGRRRTSPKMAYNM